MINNMVDESTYKELEKYEEVQSPSLLFPVLHKELENLNRLQRNREKSFLVSSVLTGIHFGEEQISEEHIDLSATRLCKYLNDSRADEFHSNLMSKPEDSDSRLQLLELLAFQNHLLL